MRKYLVVGVCLVAAGGVAIGLLGWPGHLLRSGAKASWSSVGASAGASPRVRPSAVFGPGQPIPAGAVTTVQRLLAGTPEQQRAALAPELAASLPEGSAFPTGSMLVLDAGSWQQAGPYAHATGVLRKPGAAPQRIVIGFVDSSGTWLVTFEEPAP